MHQSKAENMIRLSFEGGVFASRRLQGASPLRPPIVSLPLVSRDPCVSRTSRRLRIKKIISGITFHRKSPHGLATLLASSEHIIDGCTACSSIALPRHHRDFYKPTTCSGAPCHCLFPRPNFEILDTKFLDYQLSEKLSIALTNGRTR